MAVNYEPPSFDARTAEPKPVRGARVLAKEDDDREAAKLERNVKTLVRRRDVRCRWPEVHKCRGELECAHIVDASLGGAMATENLFLCCSFLHRRGPETIHGKQLKVEKETLGGADDRLSFWRRTGPGEYVMVARESRPGVIERD